MVAGVDPPALPRALRVVFLGTPDFAVPTLQRLVASSHPVVGVVTQPDRPRGRGQRVSAPPVKQVAAAAGIPVRQPVRLLEPALLDWLRSLECDVGIVAAYGRLLPDVVLAVPRLGFLNVHASLLPKYRGAAPVHRAILAGERETGVTIMGVVSALDAGPMLARQTRPIGPDETSEEVERDLAVVGAELMVDALGALASGTADPVPQDERQATYAPKLTRADSPIDWTWPAARIHDRVRGLHPWPRATTRLGPTPLVIHRTALTEAPGADDRPAEPPCPGAVLEARADRLTVATGHGWLQLLELQVAGRRVLTTREFLAGHPLAPLTRLGGPDP